MLERCSVSPNPASWWTSLFSYRQLHLNADAFSISTEANHEVIEFEFDKGDVGNGWVGRTEVVIVARVDSEFGHVFRVPFESSQFVSARSLIIEDLRVE